MAKNVPQMLGAQERATIASSPEATTTSLLSADAVGERIDRSGEKVKFREKLAYGVGDIGGNLIFAPISAFLLFYLTDVVGVGAAIAGTLLLFGRILDGTMDLVLGTFIDKTNTRWGKARPWILVSAPVVTITFALLFNVPASWSETGREIYTFVMYFLCLGVGFVASNLAYHALLSIITSDSKTRVSLTVLRTFFAIATTMVVQAVTMPLVAATGGGQRGWTITTAVFAVIAAITFLVVFFGTKERVAPTHSNKDGDKLPFRVALRAVAKNPYFYLIFALFLLNYLLGGLAGTGIYFAQDVLGDETLYSFLSIANLLPLLIGMWFMPPLIAKFGKRRLVLLGFIVTAAGVGVSLIDPSNFPLAIAGGLIRAIGGIPMAAALFALVADVVDYGEWKSGKRLDGMTYAAATAGQNFGAGLGVALVGWLLAAGGYDGSAEVQSHSAVSMEIFLQLGLPLILTAAMFVVMFFLNVDRHMSEMQRDLAARRAERLTAS